ncbi:MAG: hypothetical protein COV44_09345 [Deltaproteobacteria bacterium CG11_big_fil_rev_8_21_14_0_20_45_16]|nr:MAG: hypothetical protein COV44_09345 [Deltaproteobacteria bacterium CG11_big_fil_rev_8_21_14_0_20_45_16]
MFELFKGEQIKIDSNDVIQVYQALNQVQISPAAGRGPEATMAWFVLASISADRNLLYIGLNFDPSGNRMIYVSDPFPTEQSAEYLAQAEAFAGEMGFMMDDLRLGRVSVEERSGILRRVPFFYQDQSSFMSALSDEERTSVTGSQQPNQTRETTAEKYSFFLEQYVTMLAML